MRLLDLFCGAGGAAVGYHQAGFTDIVGVDINPQPKYPFEFVQDDATRCDEGSNFYLKGFDLIHASPPCQENTPMLNRWGKDSARWPNLIPQVRRMLETSGVPYVIENVAGADLRRDLVLTGEQFGLTTSRLRVFELGGWFAMSPPKARRKADTLAVYGPPDGRWLWERNDGTRLHAWASIEEGKEALEVPWMTDELEVREAIPPAYTKFIGEQFLAQQ